MAELFQQLESADSQVVEDAKQKFHDQFNIVQDSWLLNGFFDYYIASNSARCIEVMVNIREPHHQFLFNKIYLALVCNKAETRIQALTLLGHLLRKQPPWIYKITEHQCLKELFKLLKHETDDILLLLSALLVLIVLLPIVPSRMGDHLMDIFEIFSRLAGWNCNTSLKLMEEQLIHLQVALYALFQRLYGMYPCNFVAFLRNHYRTKELLPVFLHTIKPMLDSVKMHSLLVTASKERETTTERWKHMEPHDVVVECERLSIGLGDRCQHDPCYYVTSSFRSRSGTTSSATYEGSFLLYSLNSVTPSLPVDSKEFFSPSMSKITAPTPIPTTPLSQVAVQEGTSPPEAAIEATPETTPIKDLRPLASKMQVPTGSNVARALNNFGGRNKSVSSANSTPSHSQPSSPMRKEPIFSFSSEHRVSAFARKDPLIVAQKVQRLVQDRQDRAQVDGRPHTPLVHPTSPLRIIPPHEGNFIQRIESPVSLEDEEVLEIVRQGEMEGRPTVRQCDSVLQESEGGRGTEDDIDECEQEHGSPCAEGGLHMPNSRSMSDFAKRVRRLRYHSQSGAEPMLQEISTGSSPGNNSVPFLSNTVRRTSSCPDMKKTSTVPTKSKEGRSKTLEEADEEEKKCFMSCETQTDNFWPMPYEHLFLGIFPSLESNDVRPSPAPSPAPVNVQDRFPTVSPYEILDKYLDKTVQNTDRDSARGMREQLELLQQQLLFEKHRRETHALKNRRLLADAKNIRTFEEHNSALRDQVQLKQKEVDNLKEQLRFMKKTQHYTINHGAQSATLWEGQFTSLQKDHIILKEQKESLQRELDKIKANSEGLDIQRRRAEAALLDANAEVKIAKEQAYAGERGRNELEQVHKELFVLSELQKRYQEKLAQIPLLGQSEQELALASESYNNELKSLRHLLDGKTTMLEAYKTRLTELEQVVNEHDDLAAKQKRVYNEIKDECDAKLKALESKYNTQLKINVALEERVLELHQCILSVHSPDTSSCHEVVPTLTDKTSVTTGVSTHSSPLSVSLASSEGHADVKDMKNLQYMVDQKECFIKPSATSEDLESTSMLNTTDLV